MTAFLIVDDIEANRYMLKVMLEGNGYTVFQASNGLEALEVARREQPDIIVTDILMPDMDGFALCREWKQDELLKAIPFVFYTATYTDPKDEKFALSLGADRFIIKPTEIPRLLDMLQEVLTEYESGQMSIAAGKNEDNEYLQNYNEVLVRKLEQKVEQLESTNQILVEEIEERKRTEDALRDSEQQFSLLFNTMSEGLALYDVSANEPASAADYQFIKVNAAFVKLTGLAEDAVFGKTLQEVFPALEKQYFQLFERVVSTGESERFEIFSPTREKYFAVYAFCPRSDQFATIFVDTTERRKIEQIEREHERIKANFQKERERNALVQQIISRLSHDLRTQLTIIATSKDILKLYFDRLTEEKRQEKLNTIEHQINFALELLDDTIQMVRSDTYKGKFAPVPTNLTFLCKVIVEDISSIYGGNHKLIFETVDDSDLIAQIDETLVSRILMNLLMNAIKYSPPDTEIRLVLETKEDWIVIRVADNGIGIAEDDLPHIFEPFYRVEANTDVKGTGLGLSIVDECVQRHQGRIDVESTFGQGTTFTVKLPVISA